MGRSPSLEPPPAVAKQRLEVTVRGLANRETWNPADPKVSHAQPPYARCTGMKKAPVSRWALVRQVSRGSPNPATDFAVTPVTLAGAVVVVNIRPPPRAQPGGSRSRRLPRTRARPRRDRWASGGWGGGRRQRQSAGKARCRLGRSSLEPRGA